MAICGGLLGLFLGATVLSIIEIVYYSSLRLFWNFHNSQTIEPTMHDDGQNNNALEQTNKVKGIIYSILISILFMNYFTHAVNIFVL